ncbi:hypothetical protein [Aridibaculum aurantiacum]|uniref:hypothetical protein n=1 Tax=Aridibaculum aurantiacum TaxID=2810307 RepID=UPI001A976E51|nr:hypothetical protein [Aridibaculum aurantiacum]
MRKIVVAALALLVSVTIISCQQYGKKVKINEHLEVYVKNQATEEEGKKLGEYIATLDSSNTNQKSVQLSKDSSIYTVRLVIPEEHLKNNELDESFQALQYLIRENVFPGQTVRLVLTDDKFNDKRTVEELQDFSDEEETEDAGANADSTVVQ